MAERDVIAGVILDEALVMGLGEVCRCFGVSAEFVIELVDEGVVVPEGSHPPEWRFRGEQLKRMQTTLRLTRDLRVNLAGAALALDLLEELERARELLGRQRLFERD